MSKTTTHNSLFNHSKKEVNLYSALSCKYLKALW